MSDHADLILDRLAAAARCHGPPELTAERADRIVEGAVDLALALPARPRARGWGVALAAAVLVGVAGALATSLLPEEQPLELALPTGDRLTVTPGARFELASVTRERRAIHLHRGVMLLDVAPLEPGAGFVVSTPHLRARVRGTVFAVEVAADRSVVHVFEGRVEVERGGRVVALGRGQSVASDGAPVDATDAPLLAEAQLAVHAHDAYRRARDGEPHPASPEDVALPEGVAPPADPTIASLPPPPSAGARRPDDRLLSPAPDSPVDPAPDELADARTVAGWIRRGDLERALAVARARQGAEWRFLEADALRGLRRFAEAAAAYDAAAAALPPGRREQAGYLSATVRFRQLGDPAGALRALDGSDAGRPGSPLAERAAALRIRLLTALGRVDEARDAARNYAERFNAGAPDVIDLAAP